MIVGVCAALLVVISFRAVAPAALVRMMDLHEGYILCDEITGDIGHLAVRLSGSRRNCAVIAEAERWTGSRGSPIVLDGFISGLVENASPWVKDEMCGMWARVPGPYYRLQVAWGLQQLGVGERTLPPFPNTQDAADVTVQRAFETIRASCAVSRPTCGPQPS